MQSSKPGDNGKRILTEWQGTSHEGIKAEWPIYSDEYAVVTERQWALVLAGVSDFARPAETLSLTQNLALMGTGAIWTRWCLIIKPRNVLYDIPCLCTP